MAQPFWDIGGTPDSLLPDISVIEVLPDRWNWEVIYMGGRRVPGLATVKFKRAHRVDHRTANGTDGTSITSLGYKGADITIKIRLWTPQQLKDFESITIPSVQPSPGKANARPVAVTVDYPSLAMWKIYSLFVTEIAGPEPTNIPQMMEITLTASQLSPLVAVGTVTQKGGGVSTAPNAQSGKPAVPPPAPPSQRTPSPQTGQ